MIDKVFRQNILRDIVVCLAALAEIKNRESCQVDLLDRTSFPLDDEV